MPHDSFLAMKGTLDDNVCPLLQTCTGCTWNEYNLFSLTVRHAALWESRRDAEQMWRWDLVDGLSCTVSNTSSHPAHCVFGVQQVLASWGWLFLSDYEARFQVHVSKVVSDATCWFFVSAAREFPSQNNTHIHILRISNSKRFCSCHCSCYRYYCPSLLDNYASAVFISY
jgi:hypothetical protein